MDLEAFACELYIYTWYMVWTTAFFQSYSNFLLILVNSTRPASMGRVSSPAEIMSLQSSYVWSVTGMPRALHRCTSMWVHRLRVQCFIWTAGLGMFPTYIWCENLWSQPTATDLMWESVVNHSQSALAGLLCILLPEDSTNKSRCVKNKYIYALHISADMHPCALWICHIQYACILL